MNGASPALFTPALLATNLAFAEVGKLPEVMYVIKGSDLAEPGADALHDVAACSEPLAPVRLPLEEVSWVEDVGAQLKNAAETPRG